MTNAALPITQDAVERFTDRYLSLIDCRIEKNGNQWEVTIPQTAETDLEPGHQVLQLGTEVSDLDENEEPLHPESPFFHSILEDATKRKPVGKVAVESSSHPIKIPQWLQDSPVEVIDANFSPYYDRTALATLFRVSIETVSEYQTDLLRAITVDTRSTEVLPGLNETFLEITSLDAEFSRAHSFELDEDRTADLLEHTRPQIIDEVQPKIDEIHQEASRAADAELEEYRQMQQQRIEELEDQIASIASRIEELNQEIDQVGGQAGRVEKLNTRKELKSELKEAENELEDIRSRREQGFPEIQEEIRDRHDLEVVVTPLSLTEIEYESGEARFELIDEGEVRTLTVGYGTGVGVSEEIECETCGKPFSGDNPLQTISGGLRCKDCVSKMDD